MKKSLILHPFFILSLSLLLLNDFYLKAEFSNWFTGKLSDFVGLVVFSFFIAFLFPKTKTWICLLTAILFIIWKTPLVSPIIDSVNQIFSLGIHRVVDYTDYIALIILPLAHQIIQKKSVFFSPFSENKVQRLMKFSIAVLALFAICATSVPRGYEIPKGTVYIGETYKIKKSKEEVIAKIKAMGYNIDYHDKMLLDSNQYQAFKPPYYQTDNIIIFDDNSNPIDTILNVKYFLREINENKTQLEIINVTLSEDGNVQKWQTMKYLRKEYKSFLKDNLIEEIK